MKFEPGASKAFPHHSRIELRQPVGRRDIFFITFTFYDRSRVSRRRGRGGRWGMGDIENRVSPAYRRRRENVTGGKHLEGDT